MHTQLRILALALLALFAVRAQAQAPRPLPTNSLAFHLQSLGRMPTKAERDVIEAALPLMQRHGCITDFPLRSVKYDDTKKEWVLFLMRASPMQLFGCSSPTRIPLGSRFSTFPGSGARDFPPKERKDKMRATPPNHTLQRTAGAASLSYWTVFGLPSLSFCR
jgi:hypothetical protein